MRNIFKLFAAALVFVLLPAQPATTVTDGLWERYSSINSNASRLSTHTTRALCEAAVPTPGTQQCRQKITIVKTVAPVATWTKCADEEGVCAFTGRHRVRYGANNLYSIKVAEGGLQCMNGNFGGDPVPNVVKVCEVETATTTAAVTAPPVVITPPPPPVGGALSADDPRVKWWIRADMTNQQIASRWGAGVQGNARSAAECDYSDISTLLEPNTQGGRVILARSGGYFQHRIWDGMCLWQGQRQRAAFHTSDRYQDGSSIKNGRSYWFAFGGRFSPEMFTSDEYGTQILDFHHKAPSSALSGNSPWSCYADRGGYRCLLQWNISDAGVQSPTGETGNAGSQALTIVNDTSKDTTRPHFLAFRFKLTHDASGWVEAYRQIGVDGPITMLGRWQVPTTYSGSENLLFPKYGLHYFFPQLVGAPTRSMDYAGALIVEDVTVPVEVIFRSLTVAIPR